MLRARSARFVGFAALVLGSWARVAQAENLPFHYVFLNNVPVSPPEFSLFGPTAIDDSGRVYGEVVDPDGGIYLAAYDHGLVTVLNRDVQAIVQAVNQIGTLGGCVNPNSQGQIGPTSQAALFRGDHVELIPRLPGEVTSCVFAVNDEDTAVVVSSDASNTATPVLYRHGCTSVLDFGAGVTVSPISTAIFGGYPSFLQLNDRGTISGTSGSEGTAPFGFRRDPLSGVTEVLPPLAGAPYTWAVGLNRAGDVLGYSFVGFGSTENIGVWDKSGEFHVHWTEGNRQYPTFSSFLLFNEAGLIVITDTTDSNSYLVPRPGVRLNLADLVDGLPTPEEDPSPPLYYVTGLNNQDTMCGFTGNFNGFVLERVGCGDL